MAVGTPALNQNFLYPLVLFPGFCLAISAKLVEIRTQILKFQKEIPEENLCGDQRLGKNCYNTVAALMV